MHPISNPDDAPCALDGAAERAIPQRLAEATIPLPTRRRPSTSFMAFFSLPRHLLARLVFFVLLLALECLLRSSLPHTESFLAPLASFGIAAFAVFLGLGYPAIRDQHTPLPFHIGLLAGHFAALAALCLESAAAATGHEPASLSPLLLFALRIALAAAAVVQLALACIPLPQWMVLRRITGDLWFYAIVAGALTCLLRSPLQSLWTTRDFVLSRPLQEAAFASVSWLLRPLIPALQVDAPGFILRAPRFAVFIAPECSGLEGIGLVLVFTVAWLAWFRREFRFPRALLLIPAALVAVWVLDIFRIAALMLIGNSISAEVALAGFHSQAGWIAFTLVALGFSGAARNLRWIQHAPAPIGLTGSTGSTSDSASTAVVRDEGESVATPAYLVPFLAMLAASFVSRAASGAFEWLYPLRLLAALAALWYYRRSYREIFRDANGRPAFSFTLRSVFAVLLAGTAVFLLSILPGLSHAPSGNALAGGLARLSPLARSLWIGCRILSAVLTIPIAEELAFRGFFARRLITRDFDAVPYARLTLLPIALSSLAFGLMQGTHWLTGIIAGLILALLARFRNGLGDAIVAHAAANLFLALWILFRGDFGLW